MPRAVAQRRSEAASPRADSERRSAAALLGRESILALQHAVGNRTVSRLLAGTRQVARVGVEEVRAELKTDADFARHYEPWLKLKLRLSNLTESQLLSNFTLTRLKESVEQSATHHRNVGVAERDIYGDMNALQKLVTFPVDETKKIIAGQLGALAQSATLQTYAADRLKGLGGIIDTMEVLRPDAYEERYFASARTRDLQVADPLTSVDFSKGFTVNAPSGEAVRKRVCLRFGSGANLHAIHPAVHEVIHALSDPFAPTLFGHNLNEGVTEFITRKVLDEVGPTTEQAKYWEKSEAYGTERGLLATMMTQESLSENDILQAYFSFLSFGNGPREGVGTAIERFRDGERAPKGSAVLT